jgi:hypothetical protein
MSDRIDQRSICLFRALKGLSARLVSNELTAVLGADVIAYSIVTKYLRQMQFASILVDPSQGPATISIDQIILDALEHYPFSSIRELAGSTCIPTTTVHRHLTQSLGFGVKHLRWVPHTFSPTQKTERATLSIETLRQLRSVEHHGWQLIITLDESWFYLSADKEQIWHHVKEQPPEGPRDTFQDSKVMVIIAWNRLEFHLLDALPKGNTFNAEYYRVNIFTKLLLLRPQVNERRLVIHVGNAMAHTARKCRAFCEENRLRLAVHPRYSTDLAPFDFFLFGHTKHCLQGIGFPSREELHAAIHEIVGAIPQPTLEDVFRHWMERPEWVSQNNDDYYPSAKYWMIYFSRIPFREQDAPLGWNTL